MDVKLPRLGEGADSGTVASIFVKEGDTVKKDQPLLELESEKAVASIPSPSAGIITRIHVKEGDEIKVGQLIFSLEANGATVRPSEPKRAASAAMVEELTSGEEVIVEEDTAEIDERVGPAGVQPPEGFAPPAAPSIRKMARELGIDLRRVKGSERGGRIVLSDLRRYIQRLQQTTLNPASGPQSVQVQSKPPAEGIDFSRWGPVVHTKMTTLRRTISNRMVESWTSIPHITQFDEADITGILNLRKKYGAKYEKKGARLTLTSFALKACLPALKKYPLFNASLDEAAGDIVLKEYVHVGIAVDTEQGLIVPVLRNVDRKSLLELSIELSQLAERTRQRKVPLEEMQGGSFTISNQGGIGSGPFTPIINKPEAAILGMGRGVLKPVVRKNRVQPRMVLPLSLSYDHRIIDGADAARFMVEIVQAFESFKEADVKI
jgi:pyruvate dehydrogenase E2 component (dihydrolipoamide acetyltransferase)